MRGLRGIEPDGATDIVKPLREAVPGLELLVRKWPARRRPIAIDNRLEVSRPVAKEDGAVELRVAPDIIVIARIEGLTRAVEPGLVGAKNAALEDGAGVARFRAVAKARAALEDENPRSRRRKAGR